MAITITDADEWLRPDAEVDEVMLEVDDVGAGVVLRVRMVVTPVDRRVRLTASLDGTSARHDADEPGPAPTNWDRMAVGAVEWRMVEPLLRWELTVRDVDAGLHAYLAFSGSSACTPLPDGYEQRGSISGQIRLAGLHVTVTDAPARRTHTWR